MPYLLILLSLFIITGCVPQQTINLSNTFDVEQAKKALQNGNNTIKGNSFLRQNGGGVVTCAGNSVELIPYTEYTKERIGKLYNNTERGLRTQTNPVIFIPDNQDYQTLKKRTICDSQGNFKFDNVADGDYFIATVVMWAVGYTPQGGVLMQKVSVKNGELKEIVLAF